MPDEKASVGLHLYCFVLRQNGEEGPPPDKTCHNAHSLSRFLRKMQAPSECSLPPRGIGENKTCPLWGLVAENGISAGTAQSIKLFLKYFES